MDANKKTSSTSPGNIEQPENNVIKAHTEADKDIAKDPDFNTRNNKNADLDEGELARAAGDKTDLV